MSTAPSGLIGLPQQPNQNQNQSGINISGSWPGNANMFQPPSTPNLPANFGQTNQNPYGMGTRGGGDMTANLAETNLQTGLQKNQLAPIFAQMMKQYGGDAGSFFQMLTNLGSPFYQQKQQQSFTQGVNAGNSAGAQARQGIAASGAGYTPSGVGAAMMGGMGVGQAQNQAETFLNNLFQNEQLQLGGAQGLAGLASTFNPAQLMQGISPNIQQPTNTAAEDMGALTGVGSILGGLKKS